MPYHIEADSVPDRFLITGDPDRASLFASELLSDPKLISRSRGFMVYSGSFRDVRVGIASHGIGGPSALIVVEELRQAGARAFVRVGTAGSLVDGLDVGDVVVVKGAGLTCGGGGLGLYYPPNVCPTPSPDPELTMLLLDRARSQGLRPRLSLAFSSDSFYAEDEQLAERLRSLGYHVVEMECAGLLSLANIRGLRAACALVVSNRVGRPERSDPVKLRSSLLAAAAAALEALTLVKA